MHDAYFERRLPADVDKKHIVAFHHVLKHQLAGKGSDGRSEGVKIHTQGFILTSVWNPNLVFCAVGTTQWRFF